MGDDGEEWKDAQGMRYIHIARWMLFRVGEREDGEFMFVSDGGRHSSQR